MGIDYWLNQGAHDAQQEVRFLYQVLRIHSLMVKCRTDMGIYKFPQCSDVVGSIPSGCIWVCCNSSLGACDAFGVGAVPATQIFLLKKLQKMKRLSSRKIVNHN